MNWLNSAIDVAVKHKKKIIVGGALTGIVYYMYSENQKKRIEEETKQHYAKSMRQLFENNHYTSDVAVRAMLPKV
jgi:uncharacterized membrane protein YebE (DUF533 family)